MALCIQDTTELDFNGQEIAGLGPLNFEARRDLGAPVDWLVRAMHNRCVQGEVENKLRAATSGGAPLGEISFVMGPREKEKGRTVKQQLWARAVTISDGKRGKLTVTCVVAREIDASAGVKPIEWRLLTNRTASTVEEAIELIDWYRARWEIEIYFHVLKNGCQVEKLQLGEIERVQRALALFMVVCFDCHQAESYGSQPL